MGYVYKDATGTSRTMAANGSGTALDPDVPIHTVAQVTPGAGATDLGKAEDAAHASGDVGVMALAKRGDTPAATSGTDGHYEPLQVKDGQLWTRVKDGSDESLGAKADAAASTDTGTFSLIALLKRLLSKFFPEDSAHASGDPGIMALAVRNDAGTALAGTDGDYIPLTTDNTGALRVTGGGGGGGGGTQYTEDATSSGGESLTLAGTVRRNTPASSAGTDGDYATLNTDASGQLYVKAADTEALLGATNESAPVSDTGTCGINARLQRIAQRVSSLISLLPSALVTGRLDVNLGGVASNSLDTNSGNKSAGTVRVVLATDQPALTTPMPVAGNVAVGSAPSGNPVAVGGTDGTNTQRLRTSGAVATGNVHQPASNTAAVVTKAAAGAGVANVLAGIYWSYDLDPTGGSIKVEDGSGTTVFFLSITSKGPGFLPFKPALKGTANTALIVTLAAGGSGVTGKVNVNTWTE